MVVVQQGCFLVSCREGKKPPAAGLWHRAAPPKSNSPAVEPGATSASAAKQYDCTAPLANRITQFSKGR